jgi:hypothetical protein
VSLALGGGDIGSHRRPRPVLTAKATDYGTCPGRVNSGRAARGSAYRKATCGTRFPVLSFAVQGRRPAPFAPIRPKLAAGLCTSHLAGLRGRRLRLWPLEQQPRQLGDVGGDAPELVTNLSVLSSFPSLFRLQQSGS